MKEAESFLNRARDFQLREEQSMRIHLFGSCSGTEPMPCRHHTAFAIQWQGGLYWFDAGENCSYTAHMMGLDLQQVRAVFISNCHMDHVGGLGNLLWNMRKLSERTHRLTGKTIPLFFPELRCWDGLYQLLKCTEGNFDLDYTLNACEYQDGVIFSQDGLTVTALHNHHLAHQEGTPWRSFGFAIEAGGKRVVYTGDTKGLEDYRELLPCDLLLTETGHHHPAQVAQTLVDAGLAPGMLCLIHHGRDILANPVQQYRQVREILGERVRILDDQTTLRV